MLVSRGRTAMAVSFSMSAIGCVVRAMAARASTPGAASVVVVAAAVLEDPATVAPARDPPPSEARGGAAAVVVGRAPVSVVVDPSAAWRSGLEEPSLHPANATSVTTVAASTPAPRHAVARSIRRHYNASPTPPPAPARGFDFHKQIRADLHEFPPQNRRDARLSVGPVT